MNRRHFRVVTKPGLPLTVLISCLEDRVEVAQRSALGRTEQVGCIAELLEQTIPHLRRLEQLESRGACA